MCVCVHHLFTKPAFTCSRTTHLSALDNMVREAAGPDLVVLIKWALEKFVWVVVRSGIFKVAKQTQPKSPLATFPLRKLTRMFKVKKKTTPEWSPYSSASCTLSVTILLGSVVLPNLKVFAIFLGAGQLSNRDSDGPGIQGKEGTSFRMHKNSGQPNKGLQLCSTIKPNTHTGEKSWIAGE